jgi:hypothetical protein
MGMIYNILGLLPGIEFLKLSEIPNKYRYSLSVLQAQTDPIFPKARSFRFILCKYKSIGSSYLEITTVPDSV